MKFYVQSERDAYAKGRADAWAEARRLAVLEMNLVQRDVIAHGALRKFHAKLRKVKP